MDIDGELCKSVYFTNDKWEFYVLKNGLYEDKNASRYLSRNQMETIRTQTEKVIDTSGFRHAIPENEYDLDSVITFS